MRCAGRVLVVDGDIVRVMPGDEFDTATTAELPPLDDGLVRRDRSVFVARARPVVLSDVELALIDEADDRSSYRAWLRPADGGDVECDGAASSGQPRPQLDVRPASPASVIAHLAVVVLLAIPGMLVVALGIAAAAR